VSWLTEPARRSCHFALNPPAIARCGKVRNTKGVPVVTSFTVISPRRARSSPPEFGMVAAFSVLGLIVSLVVAMVTWPDGLTVLN